jgi:hypothetical protein
MPQASLVAWYGLSSFGSILTGGLPNSTHVHLASSTPHIFLPRQIVVEAQSRVNPKARLVMHGTEFESEKYGLAATGSVTYLTTWEAPWSPESLTPNKAWNEDVLRAARLLKWPASPIQWWVAPILSADYE